MNLVTAAAVFAVILPAELPDKTMIASLVLGTRFPPRTAWFGVAGAFLVHVTIAVTAGGALSLLPHWIVGAIAASLFLIGAVVLARESSRAEEAEEIEADEEAVDAAEAAGPPGPARIVATCFGIVFVAEWGDLTQIVTASLAARYHDPLSVGIGAVLALWTVAAIGVFAGRSLLRVIPMHLIRRVAAGALLIMAVITVVGIL